MLNARTLMVMTVMSGLASFSMADMERRKVLRVATSKS
jgi:hypothetical protein